MYPPPPLAGHRFFKGHGLGNDYLVVDEGKAWSLDPDAVRSICDRHRGVGGDGIVWVEAGGPPFRLRMFNPDGSEFERSGNGLRVAGAFLHREGRVDGEPFPVEVAGDRIVMQILEALGHSYDVVVDMGVVTVSTPPPFEPPVGPLDLVPVSVGNPHAVVWGAPEAWDRSPGAERLAQIGSALVGHVAFPGGTNVQLAWVETGTRIGALVWERGVGHTSASGTSACAVAASAVATGRVPPGEIEVVMEGGTLAVEVQPGLAVRLRGPVEAVMWGEVAPGVVARGREEGAAEPGEPGSGPHPREERESR